jgi:uncharacterized membrane protein YbaN (DUF454 family)
MVTPGSETNQREEEFPANANGPTQSHPRVTTGARRMAFLVAGLVCVGLGYLGVLLPGLPATPWVMLASYCFARSSPRLERWLKKSPVFGKLLRDWHEHRGIRRPAKVVAVVLVVVAVTLSITLTELPVWLKWTIGGLAAVGVSVIVFVVPTIRGQRSEDRDQKSETGGDSPSRTA